MRAGLARRHLLAFSILAVGCGGAQAPPETSKDTPATTLAPAGWRACENANACTLVVTAPGQCCTPTTFAAVNKRYQGDARRAWEPTEEQRRDADRANLTCVDSCTAFPPSNATCRGGVCEVIEVAP